MNHLNTDNLEFTIKPSQIVNIIWGIFTFMGIIFTIIYEGGVFFILIPLLIWLWKSIVINCWSFHFYENTISEKKGVFSTLERDIHYFRIKSIRLEKPFFLRIFGLSNIVLITSDPYIPILVLYAFKDGDIMKTFIKEMVNIWRDEQNLKEMDIHPLIY